MNTGKILANLFGYLTPEDRRALEAVVPRVYRRVAEQLRGEPGLKGASRVYVTVGIEHPRLTGPIQQTFEIRGFHEVER